MSPTDDASRHYRSTAWLRFHPELEREFRQYFAAQFLPDWRRALALGIVLYAGFAALDPLIVPTQFHLTWSLRFFVVVPVLLLTLASTYFVRVPPAFEYLVSLNILIGGLGIVAMTLLADAPGNHLYYAGILLCLTFGYAFLRTTYVTALVGCGALSAVYLVAASQAGLPLAILLNNAAFVLATNVVGAYACHSHEFFVRSNWLQGRLVEQRNAELQKANSELSQANHDLAASREEIVRSSRRAELIFNVFNEALPGTVLDDKYLIEEAIGAGGFGTVYRAKQILLGTPVAVKVFKPVPGHDAERSLDRFRAEGASAFRVSHPNAVRVLDFAVTMDSVAYLVMELLRGRSLEREIERLGPMDPRHVAAILQPVCEALAHAHSVGVVHRDVKPSNILLCEGDDGEIVKLIDFGIAKQMGAGNGAEFQNLTATGLFLGTPNYMAPERFLGGDCDGKADVYSVGVLAYEMLAGARPFTESGGNYLPIAMQHLHEPPPPLRQRAPRVPPDIAELVDRALGKEPAARPGAAELARHFAALVEAPA